jgi:hypothetical protein
MAHYPRLLCGTALLEMRPVLRSSSSAGGARSGPVDRGRGLPREGSEAASRREAEGRGWDEQRLTLCQAATDRSSLVRSLLLEALILLSLREHPHICQLQGLVLEW